MFGDRVFHKLSCSGASDNCVEAASWKKSSYSKASGERVEVADAESGTSVRGSKQPELGHLALAPPEWHPFPSSLKTAAATL